MTNNVTNTRTVLILTLSLLKVEENRKYNKEEENFHNCDVITIIVL